MNHPNIVTILEMFELEEKIFIVLEYCAGGDLFQLIDKMGPLHEEVAKRIFSQVIEGVAYLHQANIAHRDLKP